MANSLQKLDKFHDTRQGKVIFGAIELAVAYIVVSLALDSGALWQYAIAGIFLIGGIRNIVNATRINNHAKVKRRK